MPGTEISPQSLNFICLQKRKNALLRVYVLDMRRWKDALDKLGLAFPVAFFASALAKDVDQIVLFKS